MIDLRSLRGQLALAYAAALLAALFAFAALTVLVVDRTQRSALDDRLQTALRAVGAIVEVRGDHVMLDATDRSQLARIAGSALDAAVLDAAGAPVAASVAVPPAVARAVRAAPGPGVVTVTSNGTSLRVAFTLVPASRPLGAAVVWREVEEIVEVDQRLLTVFAFAIPVVAAFAVLAGSAVAGRGLRPLDALASVASEIEAHDLSRRLVIPPRDDELGRLCVTFDRMLDRLEGAFARERRFTGDASHELRAPLSVIRAEADLALRRARTPEEYERALRSIAAQADYLEGVTRDLLAAARAETNPPSTTANLGDAVHDAVKRFDVLARERGVAIDVAASGETGVNADPHALSRAVGCLVHNALKYARTTVTIRVHPADGAVRLVVADDGPGFSAEALRYATERFWRDDASRSHAGETVWTGAGLGLAIAAAVAQAGGGTLVLANHPAGGASAIVQMPWRAFIVE